MKVDFLFIDEIGISLDPNQPYFGIGGLKIENTIDIRTCSLCSQNLDFLASLGK